MIQGDDAKSGAKDAQSNIFTTYHIEENPLNGRVHYTSVDGKIAIAYKAYGNFGYWIIQSVAFRY